MRKITILDSNYISTFGLNGPIVTPMACTDDSIRRLIASGHQVYEKLADGTSRRLTLADLDAPVAPATPKSAVKVESVKTEPVVEETKIEEEGKAFDGLSATTSATIPEKVEEEVPAPTLTKAQRRAQKKAKVEAQKEEAEATEESAE